MSEEIVPLDWREQFRKWKTGEDPPMWQGAVPDTDKLAASIQTDPYGLWWRGSKCGFCEYEASFCENETYLCDYHRANPP